MNERISVGTNESTEWNMPSVYCLRMTSQDRCKKRYIWLDWTRSRERCFFIERQDGRLWKRWCWKQLRLYQSLQECPVTSSINSLDKSPGSERALCHRRLPFLIPFNTYRTPYPLYSYMIWGHVFSNIIVI